MNRLNLSVVLVLVGFVLLVSSSKCPKDWAEYDDECLMFSRDRRTWHDAHNFCRTNQAYLATDDNPNKHKFIRQIMSVLDGERIQNFFIGGNDRVFEGQWRWLETGIPMKGFTAWAPGKPDANATLANKYNCLKLQWVDDDLYWTDWDCNDRNEHFICEKQAADFKNTTQIIG